MKPPKTFFHHRLPSTLVSKWIISYISILFLPLLICSFYYSHTYKVIKDETIVSKHLFLENVKEQLDNNFHEYVRISTNLQFNQYLSSLSYKTDTSPSFHLQQGYLQDDLSLLIITSNLIKEIYIYFPSTEYVMSSSTVYKCKLSNYMPDTYISEATWHYLYNNMESNNCQLILTDNDKNLIFVKVLIADSKTKKPLSIIAVQLNQKLFIDSLESQLLTSNFSALAIINKNAVLSSTDSTLTSQLNLSDIYFNNEKSNSKNSSIPLFDSENKKDDYIINSIDLVFSDTRVISLTKKSIYNNTVYKMLTILMITLFTCIVLGSIVTYIYSLHNYRPIKEIMGCLKDFPSISDGKNEYSKIKEMITTTNSELEKQRIILKNNYLYKLLTGEMNLSHVSAAIAVQFHLDFNSAYSYVILLRYSTSELNNSDLSSEEMLNSTDQLAFFISQNILSELLIPKFPDLHFCFNKSEVAIILNVPENIEHAESTITKELNTFIDYCMITFSIKYFAGLSNLCSNIHLSDAFTQANNALEYIHLFSSCNLCKYSETPTESQIGYLDLKNADYIINIIMSANQQYLEEYFHNIYKELDNMRLSTGDAKSCLYFFYNVSMSLKARLLYQYPYSSTENFFPLDKNFFSYPLVEAISITENLYFQTIQFIKDQKTIGINKKASEVSQYIEANYFDINLNINSISSHFDVTPSYLSKKFKEEYGSSIIDHLYKVRITNSLKLISDTSLKISDIAQMVGFQDSNAFIRIFKVYQGCTPGKYKNSIT